MIILLVGTTGVHHTLVAAHLYLQNIPAREFTQLNGYCDLSLECSGFPVNIGCDRYGNSVYTLGLGRLSTVSARLWELILRSC